MMDNIEDRVREIEQMICRWELTPAQVFTQMRQLIPAEPAVAVPEHREWNPAGGREDLKYTRGWNDCIDAMLSAYPAPSHSQQSADKEKSEALFEFASMLEKWMGAQVSHKLSDCLNNARIEARRIAIEYRDRCPSHESEQSTEGEWI